ncbi:MAG: hypothetical protein ABR970_07270 [Roseiarcus sp.]|jgi:hypothetical protein
MSSTASVEANDGPGQPENLGEWAISTALITLTLGVGLLCVLVLSCTLTQARMSTIAIDGVNLSIWKLDDIRKQWSEIRSQIQSHSADLAEAERLNGLAEADNVAFDAEYKPARTLLDANLGAFIAGVAAFDAPLAQAMGAEGPVERLVRIDLIKDALVKAHPELQQPIDDIVKLGGPYKTMDERRIKVRERLKDTKDRVTALRDSLASSQASLDALFSTQLSSKPIDEPTRARVENALFELYTGRFPGSLINSLIVMPPDILTLALVISMGVLGSALQMTHALFKFGRVERIGAYFLRLAVGAITALVIFIVAKAGVPVIADASRLGGDAPINPYFVSFLAIISGLMSENAIVSVQAQGARFFAPDPAAEPPRWARSDLRDAFRAANRDPAHVSRLLGVESDQFTAWISGKEPAPANVQVILAGVLDTPRRDLFTDIAPDDAKPPGQGQ